MPLPWRRTPILLDGGEGPPVPAAIVATLRGPTDVLLVAPDAAPHDVRPFVDDGDGLRPLAPAEAAALAPAVLDLARRVALPEAVLVAERAGAPASPWAVRDVVEAPGGPVLLVAAADGGDDVLAVRPLDPAGDPAGVHVPVTDEACLAAVEAALAAAPAWELAPGPDPVAVAAGVEAPPPGAVVALEGPAGAARLVVEARRVVGAPPTLALLARDAARPARRVALHAGPGGLAPLEAGPALAALAAEAPPGALLTVDDGAGRTTAYAPDGEAAVAGVRYVVGRPAAGDGPPAAFYRRDGRPVRVADPALVARAVRALADDVRSALLARLAAAPASLAEVVAAADRLALLDDLLAALGDAAPVEGLADADAARGALLAAARALRARPAGPG